MTIDSSATVLQARNRAVPPLEYRFKPGQSGNPHGRPPARLTKKEKLEILAEIARHKIDSPVSAGHKVASIREANLMENVYRESGYQDNRQFNIIVSGEPAKELTQQVGQRLLKLSQQPVVEVKDALQE